MRLSGSDADGSERFTQSVRVDRRRLVQEAGCRQPPLLVVHAGAPRLSPGAPGRIPQCCQLRAACGEELLALWIEIGPGPVEPELELYPFRGLRLLRNARGPESSLRIARAHAEALRTLAPPQRELGVAYPAGDHRVLHRVEQAQELLAWRLQTRRLVLPR